MVRVERLLQLTDDASICFPFRRQKLNNLRILTFYIILNYICLSGLNSNGVDKPKDQKNIGKIRFDFRNNFLHLLTRASNDGYPKVPKDFTIMEKAPTRTFS